MATILIIENLQCLRDLLSRALVEKGYRVLNVDSVESAQGCLDDSKADLVLIDLYHDRSEQGKALRIVSKKYPHLPILMIVGSDAYGHYLHSAQSNVHIFDNSGHLHEFKEKIADLLH